MIIRSYFAGEEDIYLDRRILSDISLKQTLRRIKQIEALLLVSIVNLSPISFAFDSTQG